MTTQLPDHVDPDHPILRNEYAIYTPPIDEMIETIGDWVDRRVPGGYVHGPSRFGKSRGVKFHLRRELESRFNSRIPLVVWVRPTDADLSEAGFWHEILQAAQFAFLKPGKPAPTTEGRYLVKERFITIAREARNNYIVLLIDEAQDVSFHEWKWLTGLQNKLDWEGFRLSIFSVGTQQMAYQHQLMGNSGNAHVAARFMVENARFHGIRSAAEGGYVLNGYDCDSEWPAGSKVTFLQHFAPDEFKKGRRLATTEDDLWRALCKISPKVEEFPMQHIAFAVETTLKQLARGGDWEELTSYDGWLSTLTRTSLGRHMSIVSNPG